MAIVSRVEIPQYIDDPVQILVWSADELIPFTTLMAVGMLLERLLVFMLVAWFALKYYRQFRDGRPDGILYHSLYWTGITPPLGHTIRNSFERIFVS